MFLLKLVPQLTTQESSLDLLDGMELRHSLMEDSDHIVLLQFLIPDIKTETYNSKLQLKLL